MRILITGGAGFIGSHFISLFLEEGFEIDVFDNFTTGHNVLRNPKVKYYNGDITKPETYVMEAPDYAVHLAAAISVAESMTNPEKYKRINIEGSHIFFEWCIDHNVKGVLSASSAAIYGDCGKAAITEDYKYGGISPYADSKYQMELLPQHLEKRNTKFSFCRFFNVYGPRQDPHSPYTGVMSIFLERAKDGKEMTIFGDGEQTRDFVYVGDLVKGAWAVLESGKEGAYNIGTGTFVSINDLAKICAEFNENSSIAYGEERKGDIKYSLSNPDKIYQAVGWKAETSFSDGIQKTWSWFAGLDSNPFEQVEHM